MYGPSLGSVSRSASRSNPFRIGNPARISVTNCWLKIRNFSRLTFFFPPKPPPALRVFTVYTRKPCEVYRSRNSFSEPAVATCW